jgi:VCBS repeat protein
MNRAAMPCSNFALHKLHKNLAFHFLIIMAFALLAISPLIAQVKFTRTIIKSGDPGDANSGDVGSNSITPGDFNEDGTLDLVTVNPNTLSFYRGLGGGKYAAPVNRSLPGNLGEVLSADFDRNGKVDLAIASGALNSSGGVTILLGQGNGTFNQGTNIAVTGNVNYIALADFNGDHQPDIAASICVNPQSCSTQIFLGQGNGKFTPSAPLAFGGGPIVAGDFNADGRQDVAVVTADQVVLYLGNGDGTFQAPILASLSNTASLAVGDFYDTRVQTLAALVVINHGGGSEDDYVYSLRYSNGELLVENQHLLALNTADPYLQIAAGDLNGDFRDDLFLTGGNFRGGAVTAYMIGNGDGTFQSPEAVAANVDSAAFPFIRDINRDSRHDVGFAWTDFSDEVGGAELFINTNTTAHCAPPPSNVFEVHICGPSSGQISGPITFRASANTFDGYIKRMELWVDGVKRGQSLSDQFKQTITLSSGRHTAELVGVDNLDRHVTGGVSVTVTQ